MHAVAAALERGYTQAQLEPDEARRRAMRASTRREVENDRAVHLDGGREALRCDGLVKPGGPGRDPLY